MRPSVIADALLISALFALLSSPASATVTVLSATMDCAQAEAGAGTCGSGGTGTGMASVSYDDETSELSWNVSWSGLSGTVVAAHFHGPAPAGVSTFVQVSIGPATPAIGSTFLNATQAADLLAGLWYLNIHSTQFPGGEIRGQVSVAAIPEPSAALLLGTGFLLVGARLRKRR